MTNSTKQYTTTYNRMNNTVKEIGNSFIDR